MYTLAVITSSFQKWYIKKNAFILLRVCICCYVVLRACFLISYVGLPQLEYEFLKVKLRFSVSFPLCQ